MKFKEAFQYQFKNGLRLLGWTYLWTVVAVTVVPFLVTLLMGRLNSMQASDFFAPGIFEFALVVFLIFHSASTYDGFQFMIQNGIGRKSYFYSKVFTIGILALGGSILSVVYNILVAPLNKSNLSDGVFGMDVLYKNFFSNSVLNFLLPFILLVLLTICVAASWMFAGSVLSLFERRTQIAIIIGLPIIAIIALMVIASANEQLSLKLTWIADVIEWIVGYKDGIADGALNPFHPLISGIIYSGLVFGGTYFFNLKLKTPR